MILTLLHIAALWRASLVITMIVEGAVVIGYCLWRKKPVRPIFLTSIFGNLMTQSMLWIGLNLFIGHYLLTLLVAELLIWLLESILLYVVPINRLRFSEALFLSLSMNLASFGFGWFLPV